MAKSMADAIAGDVGKDYGVDADDESMDDGKGEDEYDAEEAAASDELIAALGVKGVDKARVKAALSDFVNACIERSK